MTAVLGIVVLGLIVVAADGWITAAWDFFAND